MSSLGKKLIEALQLQREIFGDDLFVLKEEEILESEIKTTEKIEKNLNNSLFDEPFQKAESLEELDSLINTCTKCELSKSRTKFVFGVGNPHARAMLIGEAPGADEDKQGEPFVGKAGKLLNDILKAIDLTRDDVFIANILKCRPPGNRDPLPSEMETCIPYLYKQIELINPKIILCLGRIAANGLLNKKLSLSALRGNIYEFNGIKVVVTYHPAALLRNPGWKKGCWEDVKKFKKLYDELN
ncbi:uracil-DNA glycosylase [Melioribacter sp. OK-6-Me]|uniref:uracil-DNA glycosylase n=1 Tax=unclassified Melioribacter TaxID=2627329 RepID=UPI003EDA8C93